MRPGVPDPLAELRPWESPYSFFGNNPVNRIDPTGMIWELSGLTDEQREIWQQKIEYMTQNSPLFSAMYNQLSNSETTYFVNVGPTIFVPGSGSADGQFNSRTNTITFSSEATMVSPSVLSEEMFHAFQQDNIANYAGSIFNREFEAKVAVTAIGLEAGTGYNEYRGMGDFQQKILFGTFEEGLMPISPRNVSNNPTNLVHSSSFLYNYTRAANAYGIYNTVHGIGNQHYKSFTTVAPYSLQRLITNAYGR